MLIEYKSHMNEEPTEYEKRLQSIALQFDYAKIQEKEKALITMEVTVVM